MKNIEGFDVEFAQAWAEEIDHRIAEIDGGQVRCVPAEEIFENLRQRHDRSA